MLEAGFFFLSEQAGTGLYEKAEPAQKKRKTRQGDIDIGVGICVQGRVQNS